MVDRTPEDVSVVKGVKRYPGLDFHQQSDKLYPNEDKSKKKLDIEARYYFWHFDYRNRGEPKFMRMYNRARCNSVGTKRRPDNKPDINVNSSFDYGNGNEYDDMNLRSKNNRCNSVENDLPPKPKYFGNVDRKGYRQFNRSRSAVCLQNLD